MALNNVQNITNKIIMISQENADVHKLVKRSWAKDLEKPK